MSKDIDESNDKIGKELEKGSTLIIKVDKDGSVQIENDIPNSKPIVVKL